MTELQPPTWLARDLPVLRAVARLDDVRGGPHDLATLGNVSGLRPAEVEDALAVLEDLRAVRVNRDGQTTVDHLTAIGAAMLAMQDESGLAC